MDLPAILARAPAAVPDRRARAHERARARAPQALRGRRGTCSTPASTSSRRSTSSTSSRSTTRSPSSAACACARRCPTRRSSARTRSCWSTSRPEALLERLRDGQGLSGRAHRRRAERLLPDREPHRAARDRAAPGRRGGRRQARRRARSPHRAGRRRAAARARPAAAERAAARPPRVALGAAARRRPRRALGPAARSRTDDETERALVALRQLTSVLGAHLLVARVRRRRRGRRAGDPRARHDLRPARRVAAAARPGRLREPLPQRIMRAAPRGVDVRIVAARREKMNATHVIVAARRDRRRRGGGLRATPATARTPRIARRRLACDGSCCRSPARRSRAGHSTRPCGSRAPRTPR